MEENIACHSEPIGEESTLLGKENIDSSLALRMTEKPTYSEIYDFENLYQAAKETMKEKRFLGEELRFTANLEENLIEIQNELIWHTYKPNSYREFWVYDPKKRLINAPCLKDRIVQSALCRVLEPYIDSRLDFDSYACRKEKGTLAVAERAASFANKYAHFLYLDIEHFFDTIPVLPLEAVYRKRFILDEEIMRLLHTIFMTDCNGVGIKKGCRTSQLSANVYLNEIDHFIRHKLHAKAFVRYMDDFLIFDDNTEKLKGFWEELKDFTEKNYFLRYNSRSYIGSTAGGFEFVGYKIFKKYKIVKKATLERAEKAFNAWKKDFEYREQAACAPKNEAFYRSVASYVGHCEGTASYKWAAEYLLKALKVALVDSG